MKMQNTLLTLASGLLAATMISACGEDSASNPVTQDPELNGRYANENCVGVGAFGVGVSYRETLRFEAADNFTMYRDIYSNGDCGGNPSAVIEARGSFNIDSDGAPESEGGTIQVDLEESFVTAETEAGADFLNGINYCEINDYQAGEAKQVPAEKSDNVDGCFVPAVPNTLYGVYKRNGNTLYLNQGGVSQMGESENDRPTDLDLGTAYNKQ